MNPLLSVCIPTWNRSRYLEQALDCLIDQVLADGLEDRIEIVVSDNGSSPQERAVYAGYRDHGFVRIHQLGVNIGPDAHFCWILGLARGKYAWLFGDDDLLEAGALARVLQVLEDERPDYLWLNHSAFNETDGTTFFPAQLDRTRGVATFHEREAFMSLVGPHLTFMTAHVYRRGLIERMFAHPKAEYTFFIGSNLVQLYFALWVIHGSETMAVLYEPVVRFRANNSRFYKDIAGHMFLQYRRIVRHFTRHYGYGKELDARIRENIRYAFTYLFAEKGSGHFSVHRGFELAYLYHAYPRFWLTVFPVLFIPGFLLRPLYRWYRTRKGLGPPS